MNAPTPHYLLFSESTAQSPCGAHPATARRPGRWRIVLEATDGSSKFEASDDEDLPRERLELLAVIRGLEAIPQPARVTLITDSQYVSRGVRFGLTEWRENGWQWERFGQRSSIANADLWRRLDQALRIHRVQCRRWRFDTAHHETTAGELQRRGSEQRGMFAWLRSHAQRCVASMRSWFARPGNPATSLCAS
jgi:ribonuclease HI